MRIFRAADYIPAGTISIFQGAGSHRREQTHSHDFIEVVYVLSGHAVQWVDGQEYPVCRGDVVFVNYGACHAFTPEADFQYINICFLPEVLCGGILRQENALALLSLTAFDELRQEKNGGKLSFAGQERTELEGLLKSMLKEYRQREPAWEQVLESFLRILFAKMLRKTLPEQEQLLQDTWQQLQAYIDTHLDRELTLSALAEKSFYNPSYFSRIFKQRFGVSLSRYLRERRIGAAMELLRTTSLSVEQIMERTGYRDRSAFYQAFSQIAGMTPAEYRQK